MRKSARLAEVLGGPEAVDYAPLAGEERRHRIALLRELTGLVAEGGQDPAGSTRAR